tara:strand:+ start:4141 stop:4497 length:357 start_codon:yes stop_codon:yes gene_type:complete
MKYAKLLPLLLILFPFVTFAQGSIQTFFSNLITFVNSTIVPFLIGIAFLIFVINAIRYFVIGGANQEAQEKARSFAMYSVMAMVFLIIFWGIVSMFTQSVGLGGASQAPSDYVTRPTP